MCKYDSPVQDEIETQEWSPYISSQSVLSQTSYSSEPTWNEHHSIKAYRISNMPDSNHVILEEIVPPTDELNQELEQ